MNSTDVAGDAKWDTCWRQAMYMAMHVYSDPPPTGGFNTKYPDRVHEINDHWEEWDKIDEHSGTGLVGKLFKLKNWNPEDEDAPPCPPCLAFRGTDFDDMRDLAISASIRWRVLRFIGWTHEFTFPLDQNMSPRKEWVAGQSHPNIIPWTREELIGMGFEAVPIMHDSGSLTAPTANNTSVTANLVLTLDLLAKENGDWASNIRQGLGRASRQYENAKEFARGVTRTHIRSLSDKRLEITGHSLGGGLAAAVTCVLDREFPDIKFHGMIFNAAGVHENTVSPASLSDGSVHNFTVEDEILTTLQSYATNIPVVGSIFRLAERTIGQRGMPEALGTRRVVPGKSPGGGHFGERGAALPNLFPIREQTAVAEYTGSFPILVDLDGMLQSAATIPQFGTNVLRWMNDRYREQAIQNLDGFDVPFTDIELIPIWRIYEEMARLLMEEIDREIEVLVEIMHTSVEYHGMDFVIATYDSVHPPP